MKQNVGGVLCAGNWIVDVVNTIDAWPAEGNLIRIKDIHVGVGGGAANVSANLRYLDPELKIGVSGCVGSDGPAQLAHDHCRTLNLESQLKVLDGARTSSTQVMSVEGKSRTFFYDPGANDLFDACHVAFEDLQKGEYTTFYLGYPMLLAALDKIQPDGTTMSAKLLDRAQKAGMRTCVDLVSSANDHYVQVVKGLLPFVDFLFLNEVELELATGLDCRHGNGNLDREACQKGLQQLVEDGVNEAVILHCPQTAVLCTKDGVCHWKDAIAIDEDAIRSPVGAGDAFCAGALYALHQSWPIAKILGLGHAAARANLANYTAAERIPSANELLDGARLA